MGKAVWILLATALAVGLWLAWQGSETDDRPLVEASPLRIREGKPSPIRFVRRAVNETGVAFANRLAAENNFTYINNGAGLAVGDFDQNGLPDLYLVSMDGPNGLFRQVAPWQFENVTAAAGVDGGEAWGTGATFADVDGDGWLDLYVCNLEAPNLLYRNRGDGTFEECAAAWGLDRTAASTMAAFADYDNDGDLDVYLLANRVFSPELADEVRRDVRPPADTAKTVDEMQPNLPYGDEWLQYYDRQNDRWNLPEAFRDHFVFESGRPFYGGQPDRLMRNDGSVFVDATESAGMGRDQAMGLSATWWDMDDDGWLDLYVANDLESRDRLWRNRGDGTFVEVTEEALPHVAYFGMGSDFADIDGDGHFDFMVADMASTSHLKGKWLMGEMSDRGWFLEHARPQQYMRNSLFLNTGMGRFREIAFQAGVAATDWTWSVRFGDLDNDGWEDLFVTNGIARFDNDPDLKPRIRALAAAGRREELLELIRNIQPWPEANLAFRNDGSLHFDKVAADWGLAHEGVTHGAALADLDRDGDLDVVALHFGEDVGLYENTSARAGHGGVLVELEGRGKNPFGIGARVTARIGERTLSRLNLPSRGYLSGQEPVVHLGVGAAREIDSLRVDWPGGAHTELHHLPIGHRLVVREPGEQPEIGGLEDPPPMLEDVTTELGWDHRHRERPFDDFEAQPLLPWRLSRLGPALAHGDIDGDGQDEWFVGGAAGQAATLWQLAGGTARTVGGAVGGAIEGDWARGSEAEDLDAVFFDADGDGDEDLYIARGGVEIAAGALQHQDRLLRNDAGRLVDVTREALPPHAEPSLAVAAGDADGDGDLDLFVGGFAVPGAYPESGPSRLLRNEGGRFVEVPIEGLSDQGLVTDAAFVDIDRDGDADLITVGWWRAPRLWLQEDGDLREAAGDAWGLADLSGWWNCILPWPRPDGGVDLVLGNFGKNHKYKASEDHPSILYCSDFDGDGTQDLVESKWEGDRHLPVRGRSCSSRAMPFVAQKFGTYEEYARSDLLGIYGEGLRRARQFEARELRHVILRSRPGTVGFDVEALPAAAQMAPVFAGTVLGGPGPGTGLVLGQNFFSPEPETGRMDGGVGVVLVREPDAALAALAPEDSGLVAPGDTKGVGWDGRHLVFAANDGPLQVWIQR